MVHIDKVVIPVANQDRALQFWNGRLGFDLATDAPYGTERWLEVRSPDGITLVLELTPEQRAAATPDHLPTSNVMFSTPDIMATHRELVAKGVAFPQPPIKQPFGWWAMFSDDEGNRFALGQRDD